MRELLTHTPAPRSLYSSPHPFLPAFTVQLSRAKGVLRLGSHTECWLPRHSGYEGSLKPMWTPNPQLSPLSEPQQGAIRGGQRPHPKVFPAPDSLIYIHELMTTLSTSQVTLNIEAILAGYCNFPALSYSNYLFYFFLSFFFWLFAFFRAASRGIWRFPG